MDIHTIKNLAEKNLIEWTSHIKFESMIKRNISEKDVVNCLLTGELIEDFPSYLVLGLDTKGQKLHVACAVKRGLLILKTTYAPTPDRWEQDMKTRKRKNKE